MIISFFPSELNPVERVKAALEFANNYENAKVYYKLESNHRESVTAYVKSGDSLFMAYSLVLLCCEYAYKKGACLNCGRYIDNKQ